MLDSPTSSSSSSSSSLTNALPDDTIYTIQMATKSYLLSGKLLSVDSPNKFTEYFQSHKDQTKIYVFDRCQVSFELIINYLRGCPLIIENETQFSIALADSMYYDLSKLRSILKNFPFYFLNVSSRHFKISKNLITKFGDYGNFFKIATETTYCSFEQYYLLNDTTSSSQSLDDSNDNTLSVSYPPLKHPLYLEKNPDTLADLLTILQDSNLNSIKDLSEARRINLFNDCKFYRLNNLLQLIINFKINYNHITKLQEIIINLIDLDSRSLWVNNILEDSQFISPSASPSIQNRLKYNNNSDDEESNDHPNKKIKICIDKTNDSSHTECWNICRYKRQLIDDYPRDLIFQINNDSLIDSNTLLNIGDCNMVLNKTKQLLHITLTGNLIRWFKRTFTKVLTAMNLNITDFEKYLPISNKNSKDLDSIGNTKCIKHLILPACISICDLKVNNQACPNLKNVVMDKSFSDHDEYVMDFSNLNDLKKARGMNLYLKKSLWKLGIQYKKLLLIAIKADAICGNTKESSLNSSIDFL
ncbi:hypothetical protein TBLA_0D03940 [Henningerozyma blattae CBS 6284]|uniref:Potassium channel tetramerisation-type BTB domain-containing protein n=1 Tax=Henningerozyma blattae (strain ATCC 34711 / CBS 6284 / DSM 70876 / NBRC 10599 / NRRL Y-10934 / UCD 77-7) TaxID=1071380 RepID=I2H3D9_HENB6|nr:hypothetical protein TBLA_0D03940 [Tetrapisispora blattae CBS 6284]CCH60891.1 hypothetical protein TBLA_0D03940 [Tetrapisispora blattae CBS 6284]